MNMADDGDYCIGSRNWPGMAKVIEECGELMQVMGKIMSGGGSTEYWDGTNLRLKLLEELADVNAALLFFGVINNIPYGTGGAPEMGGMNEYEWYNERKTYKYLKFMEWHQKQLEENYGPTPPTYIERQKESMNIDQVVVEREGWQDHGE